MFRTNSGYGDDAQGREHLLTCLRDALVHLHEPDRLRQNPLAAAIGTRERFSSTRLLYDVLVDAIAELEPTRCEAPCRNSQDTYEILYYRYVQQMPQSEVAAQLGVGVRHLRRKQQIAIESLADTLLGKTDLREKLLAWESPPQEPESEAGSLDNELSWLVSPDVEHRADPKAILFDVLEMLQPLADERDCTLRTRLIDAVPQVATNPIALRQILLDVLGTAVGALPGGQADIDLRLTRWAVEITVSWGTDSGDHPLEATDYRQSLRIASKLAVMSGGRLDISQRGDNHLTRLVLPTLEGSSVLVVDDNTDFLRLVRRYLTGTRYRLVTTPQPDAALSLAAAVRPKIVVLDVMMPGIDGWELLSQFRQNPGVQHIPVMVCTIVGSDDLAHSLGASGYLQKPVTREALLASLDRLVRESDQAEPASS